jgi:membrane-bound lytic murein transglycosylase B
MAGLVWVSTAVFADEGVSFEQWLVELKVEALTKGISALTLERAFAEVVEPIPRVVELDRKQPEFTLTLDQYLHNAVSQRRIDLGRQKLVENAELLARVYEKYGVPPQFLVAFWGVETDFGRLTGGHNVIAALSTLAYDGRRSAFFRSQLFDALHIIEAGNIEPENMRGSWAGAMGQAQFMPSTFRKYAVDFDGDGRIDLWNSKADVFASAANYLSTIGWSDELTWGREVELPGEFDEKLFTLEIKKSLADWHQIGVRRLGEGDLPLLEADASLIRPDEKPDTRTFLVYDNFRTILHWNRSNRYAIAVGLLADRISH